MKSDHGVNHDLEGEMLNYCRYDISGACLLCKADDVIAELRAELKSASGSKEYWFKLWEKESQWRIQAEDKLAQLLCANCNQGKKRNGEICPHKLKKDQ